MTATDDLEAYYEALLFIAVGLAICEQNNVIDAPVIQAAHHFLGASFEPLVDLCRAGRLDHLDLGFGARLILKIRSGNNYLSAIAERDDA